MTREEKQILLRDLCARIPYRTLVQLNPGAYNKPETCILTGVDGEEIYLNVDSDPFRIGHIKPYLRPMSSMTKEEFNEYMRFIKHSWEGIDKEEDDYYVKVKDRDVYIDWLLEHHLDFHGLIEKGLALEAPADMYKTE